MARHLLQTLLLGASALSVPAYAQEAAQPVEEEALPAEEEALPAEEEAAPAAQDDGPAADAESTEIVVTATKREQSLRDVPVAVSVAGAEAIERAAVRDLKDLQSIVPTLRVTQLQSAAQTNFIIRGFGNGANNAGIEPSVGVFVDGVYRSRTAAQIGDLPEISRVEVLRGPQSTLFGKNASAGVISMITRAPSHRFQSSLEASYGNYDATVLRGYVTGGLSDQIAASISAGINKRDGYVTEAGFNGRGNERDRWFARGQLLIEPSSLLTFRLIADFDRIDETCCAVFNLRRSSATSALEALGGRVNDAARPFDDIAWSNFPSSNRIENWGLSAEATYQIGPLKLSSITAWRESSALTDQDSDFTSARLVDRNRGEVAIGTFTQELRAQAGLMDIFNAMLGGYFFREDVTSANSLAYGTQFRPYADLLTGGGISNLESALFGAPSGVFFAPGQGLDDRFSMDNTAWSVFGNIEIQPRSGLTVSLGANYTRDTKHVVSAVTSSDVFSALDLSTYGPAAQALKPLQFLPPFRNFPNAVENGRTRDGDWSWNARLAVDLGERGKAYVSYATGFKASSFNLSRDSRPLASDFSALSAAGLLVPNLTSGTRFAAPEDAKSFEFGIKGDWKVVNASLAVFRQTITGFQSNIFTGTGFSLSNAGKQSTFGVEFEGQARPAPGLVLNIAAVWLDPKYDRYPNSPLGDLSGLAPAGIPGLSATIGAQWSHGLSGGNRLTVRTDYHYESPVAVADGLPGFVSRDANGNVISFQPGIDAARPFQREVSDLSASVSLELANGLELALWGRNLTDSRYLVSIFDSVAQPGSISGYSNQPRTYGITARFKW